MRNECNIIRDILPLYAEDMVSDNTVSFVEEHLQTCNECSVMYERIKEGGIVMKNENKSTEQEVVSILKKLRKKVFKRQRPCRGGWQQGVEWNVGHLPT